MSADHVFMVALDVLDPTVDLGLIRDFLKSDANVQGWWNHIPGCFLVATNLAAEQLTDEFRKATRNARLLVMEVNPSASEGWLPERSWNWILKRETEDAR